MLEEQNIWNTIGNYLAEKTPGEILSYAFDVNTLADEIKQNTFTEKTDFSEDVLCEALTKIIQVSANLLQNVKKKVTTNVTPAELEKFFKYINRNDELIYFDKKKSKALVKELSAYEADPNNPTFALLDHAFILNRSNAEKLLTIIGNEIDPESEILPKVHNLFGEHRLKIKQTKPDYYNYFFNKQDKFKSAERRQSFLDYIFGMDYHYHMPITYKQAWQFIKVASDDAKQHIFGKSEIKKTDNIELGVMSWAVFFEELKDHNENNPDKKIKFNLEPYQNRRILQHLPLELALLYEDMFISKITNTGEKSIATGSRVMIAVGQVSRVGQILSVVATAFVNVAVFVKSYLLLPILVLTILVAGKKSHHDEIKKDQKHQKKFLLNADSKITVVKDLRQVKKEIKGIRDKYHDVYGENIDHEIPIVSKNLNQMNVLHSPYSIMNPTKAGFLDKKDSIIETLKHIAKKLKPIAGPLIRGLLTGGALFIICMIVISTSWLTIIVSGIASLLLGGLIVFTGYRNDKQKACARKIRKNLKTDITTLQTDLSCDLRLKNRLVNISDRREGMGDYKGKEEFDILDTVIVLEKEVRKKKKESGNDNNANPTPPTQSQFPGPPN